MAKHDEAVINYSIFEDGTEYLGTSEVTLPEIAWNTSEFSGAGIAGTIDEVILGHLEAMSATFSFNTVTDAAISLNEPRVHNIDIRVAQQKYDTRSSATGVKSVRHVMKMKPKKFSPGKAAKASTADASGEYSVFYYAMYIDDKIVTELDPLNFICVINGNDYLADVRKALGK